MEWIRQLQGLDAYRSDIELWSTDLSAADLVCLGQALPDATGGAATWHRGTWGQGGHARRLATHDGSVVHVASTA